jgi:hypothetical protein
MKPKAQKREADRPTEDDIAQVSLGGSRGSKDLEPAKMTRRQKQDMPSATILDIPHRAARWPRPALMELTRIGRT